MSDVTLFRITLGVTWTLPIYIYIYLYHKHCVEYVMRKGSGQSLPTPSSVEIGFFFFYWEDSVEIVGSWFIYTF